MQRFDELTVVVPAYNRVVELRELLDSVLAQHTVPARLLIVEDCSPSREQIRALCAGYRDRFTVRGIDLSYVENPVNLGFDRNIRFCIESVQTRWALMLGNDDLLLPEATAAVARFVATHDVNMVSRSFVRFNNDISQPLGVSSLSDTDTVFRAGSSDPKMFFRAAAFIGGLIFDVPFSKALATTDFDGTLYYQIHLAANAFCAKGIGYIATPIVGGRADNPPMFGAAATEQGTHAPGGYSARSRAVMWKGVLDITRAAQAKLSVSLVPAIVRELTVRQSFHIFEMNAGASRAQLRELRHELGGLGLFSHPLPRLLFAINTTLGRHSIHFYKAARRAFQ